MTLEQCKQRAQQAANDTGKPHSVLNFNTVGQALYVVREQPSEEAQQREGSRWCVWTALPRD